jgi:hypothetical protein
MLKGSFAILFPASVLPKPSKGSTYMLALRPYLYI